MEITGTRFLKKRLGEQARKIYLPKIVLNNPLFATAWLELLDSKGLSLYVVIETYWNADGGGLEYVDSWSSAYEIRSGVLLADLFNDLEYGEYDQYASLYIGEKGLL